MSGNNENQLRIEYKKPSSLLKYEKNSRTHSELQVEQIAKSITEFGFTNPILINKDKIIAGHGRLEAAKKLGMSEVPTIQLDYLSEEQIKALVIADNQLALNAGWDIEALSNEIEELKLAEFDIELLGFDDDFLNKILEPEKVEGLTDEDDVPEPPEEPVTRLGDLWILGNHRLLCGDSTSIDDVERLMDGRNGNICFTSPPYNAGSMNISGNESTKTKYNSFNDNQSESEYFDFLISNIDCMVSVCDEVFYNIGLVQNNKRTIFKVVDHYGDIFKDVIYWKKSTVAPHIQKGVINNLVEFILCFGDGNRKFINPQFSQGSYWNVIEGGNASGNEYSKIHKATFPVYLPENIIKNFTSKNGIVVDCFGGTGTTIIACEKLNREARIVELDPVYCDVIIKRWQDFTGKEAVLESTGEKFNDMIKIKESKNANNQ